MKKQMIQQLSVLIRRGALSSQDPRTQTAVGVAMRKCGVDLRARRFALPTRANLADSRFPRVGATPEIDELAADLIRNGYTGNARLGLYTFVGATGEYLVPRFD